MMIMKEGDEEKEYDALHGVIRRGRLEEVDRLRNALLSILKAIRIPYKKKGRMTAMEKRRHGIKKTN